MQEINKSFLSLHVGNHWKFKLLRIDGRSFENNPSIHQKVF